MRTYNLDDRFTAIRPVDGSRCVGLVGSDSNFELRMVEDGKTTQGLWKYDKGWRLSNWDWILPASENFYLDPFIAICKHRPAMLQRQEIENKWSQSLIIPDLPRLTFESRTVEGEDGEDRYFMVAQTGWFAEARPLAFNHPLVYAASQAWEGNLHETVLRLHYIAGSRKLFVLTGISFRLDGIFKYLLVAHIIEPKTVLKSVSSPITDRDRRIDFNNPSLINSFLFHVMSGGYVGDESGEGWLAKQFFAPNSTREGKLERLFESRVTSSDLHPFSNLTLSVMGFNEARIGRDRFPLSHNASKCQFSADGCTAWFYNLNTNPAQVTVIDVD